MAKQVKLNRLLNLIESYGTNWEENQLVICQIIEVCKDLNVAVCPDCDKDCSKCENTWGLVEIGG